MMRRATSVMLVSRLVAHPVPPAVAQDAADAAVEAKASVRTASMILAAQPTQLVERLEETNVVVMQEVREEGALSGGIITSYVMFEPPIDQVYGLLSQSERQVEFRPELTSIETIEMAALGPVDEQRMKILFQRYIYHIEYRLQPAQQRIEWHLDERFENDLDRVSGFWELFATDDGHTLGRSGTSVDVGAHVPGFLQDWITRKNLPRTMERVRKWVDSGGTYRP
jgi:hypothetical protein